MATNSPLDPTGRSILTQVAFKAAVDAACVGGSYNEAAFLVNFEMMQAVLKAKVIEENEEFFIEATARKAERIADGTYQQAAPDNNVADVFADEFGATPVGGVEVAGKQHGPLPAWLAPAAAAKGVTKVWDNRIAKDGSDITQKVGKTPPWFKSTEGDIPFWPPRS